MSEITVYLLVLWMGHGNAGGPATVDNISTKVECERLAKEIKTRFPGKSFSGDNSVGEIACFEVKKSVAK